MLLPAKKLLTLILIFTIILTSCQSLNEITDEQSEVHYDPVKGGHLIFAGTEPKTLNPLINVERDAYHFLKLIFEGLIDYDENLKPRPLLARDWNISEIGNSCTFNLREDIKWHDGTPMTAKDVIFTLEYLKNFEDNKGLYSTNIARVMYFEAIDNYTVKVVFDQWFNGALDIMTFPILPSHIYSLLPEIDDNDDDEDNRTSDGMKARLVGTGPYRYKEYEPYRCLELELNPYWWGDTPYIEEMEMRFVADEATALTHLKNDEGDMAIATSPDWERYKEGGKAYTRDYITSKYDFLGLNFTNPIFNDKALRKGIQYGINRREIADKVYLKHAVLVDTPIPPGTWLYSDDVHNYPYDVESAKEILGEAGWADRDNDGILEKEIDGIKHDLEFTLLASSDNPKRFRAAEMIRDDLINIGISVTLEDVDWEQLLQRVYKKDFDAVILGWDFANYMDLSFAFHSSQIEEGSNYFSYNNEEMDRLLQQDFRATEKNREKTSENLQQFIAEELPYNSLYFKKAALIVKNRIKGTVDPREHNVFLNVEQWYIPTEFQ